MKKHTAVFFDLDGTITDSSVGITKSVAYALKKRGYGEVNPAALTHFIGPPLREQFMAHCGVDEAEGAALVTAYREYYTTKGILECSVYEGIPELLRQLADAGPRLFVATSKPEVFARQILEHFDLARYFEYIGGANLDNTRTSKSEVIAYVAEYAEIRDIRTAVMVGDCTHDVIGAAKLGMDAIAVSYGFGKLAELQQSKPLCICGTPHEVGEYLLNG